MPNGRIPPIPDTRTRISCPTALEIAIGSAVTAHILARLSNCNFCPAPASRPRVRECEHCELSAGADFVPGTSLLSPGCSIRSHRTREMAPDSVTFVTLRACPPSLYRSNRLGAPPSNASALDCGRLPSGVRLDR